MAIIQRQVFTNDPILGTLGHHRILFQSTSETVTFPPLLNAVNGVRVINQISASTPVQATLTDAIVMTNLGVDNDTVTIGGIVYTLQGPATSNVVAPFDVFIGTTSATVAANLIKAINGIVDSTGVVGPNTPPNPTVYATQGTTTSRITLTARTPGAGSHIAITELLTNGTVSTPLAGGSGLPILPYVTSAATGTVVFNGQVAGDIVDVVTYHGPGIINTTATA